jgi:hypothetical protein
VRKSVSRIVRLAQPVRKSIVSPLRRALATTAGFIAPRTYRHFRLVHQLTSFCRRNSNLDDPIVSILTRPGGNAKWHLVAITRKSNQLSLSCLDLARFEDQNEFYVRVSAVFPVIANAPVNDFEVVADLSDGEESAPGLLSFCSREPGAVLIPDHVFVQNRGYEEHRQLARASRTQWNSRSDRIVWRGSTTGAGKISNDTLSAGDLTLRLRVRLCLRLRGIPGCDAKISGIVQSNNPTQDKERLKRAGILGEFIPPIAWHTYKFAIDVDGNSNAWANLFTRLIMGCCVLKISSPLHYRQWYYPDLSAWTHYVPVKSDLSDLEEQIAWCRANLDECRRIAANGQAFAMARSYEAEMKSAARRVSEAFKNGLLRTTIACPSG